MWIAVMTIVLLIIAKRRPHGEIIHVKSKISRTQPRMMEKKKMMKSSSKAERAFMAATKPDNYLV